MYHPSNSTIEVEANITMYRKAVNGCEIDLKARAGDDWRHRDDLITDPCEEIRRTYRAWKQARNGLDSMLETLGELRAKQDSE